MTPLNDRGRVPAEPEGDLAGLDLAPYRAAGAAVAEAAEGAARRFAEHAAGEGLLDVAYATTGSPFGPLIVAVTPRGLVRLAYPDETEDAVLADLAARVSPRVLASPAATGAVRRELDEYFEGRRRRFDVKLDLTTLRGFRREVLRATARIPYGSVRTYREVATSAGSPAATRAAGNALGSNPVPIVLPCHRVVRTGGGLGGYTGGLDRKVALLRLEGALAAED